MMRLGQTSWMGMDEALKKYREARNTHRAGFDPQGTHPVTREAKYLLYELWWAYDREGGLPGELKTRPTVDELADFYSVQPSSIVKLAAFDYLRLRKTGTTTVVIPLRDALLNMPIDGCRLV